MDTLMTVDEVARMIGLPKRQVYDRVARGEVTAIRIRNSIRFERGEAKRLLRSLESISQHMTVADVSDKTGIHPATIRKMIRSGELGATKVGREYRISPEVLRGYYEQNRYTGGDTLAS